LQITAFLESTTSEDLGEGVVEGIQAFRRGDLVKLRDLLRDLLVGGAKTCTNTGADASASGASAEANIAEALRQSKEAVQKAVQERDAALNATDVAVQKSKAAVEERDAALKSLKKSQAKLKKASDATPKKVEFPWPQDSSVLAKLVPVSRKETTVLAGSIGQGEKPRAGVANKARFGSSKNEKCQLSTDANVANAVPLRNFDWLSLVGKTLGKKPFATGKMKLVSQVYTKNGRQFTFLYTVQAGYVVQVFNPTSFHVSCYSVLGC
jgi:hypothetical protein